MPGLYGASSARVASWCALYQCCSASLCISSLVYSSAIPSQRTSPGNKIDPPLFVTQQVQALFAGAGINEVLLATARLVGYSAYSNSPQVLFGGKPLTCRESISRESNQRSARFSCRISSKCASFGPENFSLLRKKNRELN